MTLSQDAPMIMLIGAVVRLDGALRMPPKRKIRPRPQRRPCP